MDHMQFLVERSSGEEGEFCGHALMASCPPVPDPDEVIPFGHGPRQNEDAQKTWDLSKGSLTHLLDISMRLNLDGELTPVMAWGVILAHHRFRELTKEDINQITTELSGKIRCYGFGAVLEDFEVRDALANVFNAKPELEVA